MPRLTDEERERLPLEHGSSWTDDRTVRDAYLDEVRVHEDKRSRTALVEFQEGVTAMFVADVLAVITAAGLNPWYERCRELERENARLKEQLGFEPES